MRRGTLITVIALFVVILVVGVIQLMAASGDQPECPGPTTSPNALPSSAVPQDCR